MLDLDGVPPHLHGGLITALEKSVRSVRYFAKFWFGFEPHEKQITFLDPRPRRAFLSCGAGFGKTRVFALDILWQVFRSPPGQKFCVIAPTHLQAGLIVRAMKELIAQGDGKFAMFIRRWPTKDDPHVYFENGTTLMVFHTARGAEFMRGFEFNRGWMDEAAMDKDDAYQLFRTRVRLKPGTMRIGSTPKGKNWFFRESMLARAEMERAAAEKREAKALFVEASSWDNPYMDREYLLDLEANAPRRWYEQEILGMFVDAQGASFRQEDLDRVFDATWEGEESPRHHGLYAHGWDFGKKTTYTVGTTLAYDHVKGVEGEIRGCGYEEHYGERWTTVFHNVDDRENFWRKGALSSTSAIDATGLGDVVNDALTISAEPIIFSTPWRSEMTLRMQKAVETPGMLRLPRSWTKYYSAMQLHTAKEDAAGETWDHYDSLGLALYEAMRLSAGGIGFYRM